MIRKTTFWAGPALAAWVLMAAGGPRLVLAEEPSVVEDVIVLLQERGVIEAEDAVRMVERNRTYENKKSWIDRLSFFGDFRSRYDGMWFNEDPLDNEQRNRSRLRYRFRFGAKAEINDYFDLKFRLSSSCEHRSGNQTLGRGLDCEEEDPEDTDAEAAEFGFDWDPDGIYINQAYITFHTFGDRSIPYAGRKLDWMFGKMPNFFHSKAGKDYLVWDTDLSPEGAAVSYVVDPLDGLSLTFNSGFFVLDENSSHADPWVVPVQLRVEGQPTDSIAFGSNLSYYGYGDLDGAFFTRSAATGNLADGYDPDLGLETATSFGLTRGRSVNIGDLRAWFEFTGIEDWPILVYGNVVNNFSAQSLPGSNVGKESLGWSAGLEIGDKKKYAMLGAGYFLIEANAGPARLIDSDLFDGRTNRKGWAIYGAKRVLTDTDLKFTLFLGEPLEDDITIDGAPYADALENSDRIRLQTDVIVKF
jgi:hypothetical protein